MTEPPLTPQENVRTALKYLRLRHCLYENDPWHVINREQREAQQLTAQVAERRLVRDAKRAAERDKVETAHYKALADSLGFRRAVLELHAPTFEEFGFKPSCSCCSDSEWGPVDWPCETYVLARDWREASA